MSHKKTILRALHLAGADSYVRPSSIPGFDEEPDKYQKAVNDLLRERLIEGRSDAEGRMTIALNEHRMGDVRRALRPIWAHPAVLAAIGLALALGAGLAS